jgi:N-acetylneuraminic acid mutarotase
VASVVYDNKVYAIGGQYRHDTRPKDQASVHVYDPKQDRWQQLADLPEPRSHVEPATFLVNHHIVIVGGKNSCLPLPIHINPKDIFYRINRKLNNLYSAHQIVKKITAYDIQNDRWLDLRELPESLNAPTARFMQNQLFVTGGGATSGYNTRCRTLLNETLLDAISQVD